MTIAACLPLAPDAGEQRKIKIKKKLARWPSEEVVGGDHVSHSCRDLVIELSYMSLNDSCMIREA